MVSFSNRDALNFLHKLNECLSSSRNNEPPLIFDEKEYVGNGFTRSYFDDVVKAEIGVSELANNKTDEYVFMKAFMSLLHETTHIFQHQILLKRKDDTSRFIALGYFAAMASKFYYDSNYFLMPDEIAAQYSALKNAYTILCKLFSKQEANDMICRYVNKHIKDEFIQEYRKKDYSSVAKIFSDYEKAFKASKYTRRVLNVEELLAKSNDFDKGDYIVAMAKNSSRKLPLILNSKSGIQQDFYLTSIFIHTELTKYNERKSNLKSISDLNFNLEFPGFGLKSYRSIKRIRLDDATPDFSQSLDLQMLPKLVSNG